MYATIEIQPQLAHITIRKLCQLRRVVEIAARDYLGIDLPINWSHKALHQFFIRRNRHVFVLGRGPKQVRLRLK